MDGMSRSFLGRTNIITIEINGDTHYTTAKEEEEENESVCLFDDYFVYTIFPTTV